MSFNTSRRLPPQINPFRPFVTRELQRRKVLPIAPITPFTRLTSCMEEPELKYRFFTLGTHGFTGDTTFDLSYGDDREIVGYAYDDNGQKLIDASQLSAKIYAETFVIDGHTTLSDNEVKSLTEIAASQKQKQNINLTAGKGAYPIPGIVSATIDRNAEGAGITAKVKWVCYNRQQMEYLRHHFMTVGTSVVFEWGQNFSTFQPQKEHMLDFSKPTSDVIQELSNCYKQGATYIMENYTGPNNGLYSFIVGSVYNFYIEFEAMRGIYVCTTEICSSGEYLWGINTHNTVLNFGNNDNIPDTTVQTIAAYFNYDSSFDLEILTQQNIKSGNVTVSVSKFTDATATVPEEYKDIQAHKNDYVFMTWNYFVNDIIPDLLSIAGSNSQYKQELTAFLKFARVYNQDPDDTTSDQKLWIGNNQYLRSTDPETMLIIRSDMKDMNGVPDEFTGGGYFDQSSAQLTDRGLLTKGIWLNTGMIRECFLQSSTFQQAISTILTRMNNASAGYWDLQLYYDEEAAGYRIIDRKFGQLKSEEFKPIGDDSADAGVFYKFNANSVGECIELNLDSVYPPEVVAQMAAITRLQMLNPTLLIEDLKKWPVFGTTSHFAFALNWTNFTDLLQQSFTVADTTAITSTGIVKEQDASPRLTNRLVSETSTYAGLNRKTETTPSPGAAIDDANPSTDTLNAASSGPSDIATTTPSSPAAFTSPTIPKASQAQLTKLAGYDDSFARNAARLPYNKFPGLNGVALLKAISSVENPSINPSLPPTVTGNKNQYAVGLMQVMNYSVLPNANSSATLSNEDSAKGTAILQDPDTNITAGTTILLGKMNSSNIPAGDLQAAISAYNGGYVPSKGLGVRYGGAIPTNVVLARDASGNPVKGATVPVTPGQFGNASYVNAVMAKYNQFKLVPATTPTAPVTSVIAKQPADATAVATPNAPGSTDPKALVTVLNPPPPDSEEDTKKKNDIIAKFGNVILYLVYINPMEMIKKITRNGIDNHSQLQSNSFVAPFPTTSTVELKFQGIAGISLFDGFFVDKLPYIYEQYGVFHAVQLREEINEKGWTTVIVGQFRVLYFDGTAPDHLTVVY